MLRLKLFRLYIALLPFLVKNSCIHHLQRCFAKWRPGNAIASSFQLSTSFGHCVRAEVQIISENPWHLYHAGVLTLRDNKGERVTNPYGEPVLIIREFFMMSTSQQESFEMKKRCEKQRSRRLLAYTLDMSSMRRNLALLR